MKIKCSFIYETNEYETFAEAKEKDIKIKSRKQIETDFAEHIKRILYIYTKDNIDSFNEIKAKIIERKDNG